MDSDHQCLLFDIPLGALRKPAELCTYGCEEAEIRKLRQWASDLAPEKTIVALQDWLWIDLEYPLEKTKRLNAIGLQPACLWSSNVIFDTSGRWQQGQWVITTELLKLHQQCLFETRHSIFLLVGQGRRRKVKLN